MKTFVTIGGNLYEFQKIHYKRQVGTDSQIFEGWFQIAGARFPNFGDVILVKKEVLGTFFLKWEGKVNRIDYLPSIKGTVHIVGYDLNRKSSYNTVANKGFATPTKCSGEFTAEIAPNSLTDLTAGSITTTDTAPDSVNFGKSITGSSPDSLLHRNQAIEILEMIANADAYIHRDGTADFKPGGAGTDRSTTMILIDGMNGYLVDPGYSEDNTRIVKKVIIKGQGASIKNGYIGSAQDGAYSATTDKVRQMDMPFLVSHSTCNTVAANVLTELNKTAKYAKYQMVPDLFKIDYDIYDTVRLKALLPNKTVDANLKIYSIDTEVSQSGQQHEIVTFELSNFGRGIFAPLILPSQAGNAAEKGLSLSSSVQTVTDQGGLSGGASVVEEDNTGGANATLTTTQSDIFTSAVFSSSIPIAGVFVHLSLEIKVRKFCASRILWLQLFDGTNNYPTNNSFLAVQFNPYTEAVTHQTASLLIPVNLAGKSLTIKGKLQSSGEVFISLIPYFETLGEHTH